MFPSKYTPFTEDSMRINNQFIANIKVMVSLWNSITNENL